MELVPIKIKITIDENSGQAKYPDFNQLQCVIDSKLDWSRYIDIKGSGWLYDRTSGHKDDTNDSPIGQQWGMLLVPEIFAEQANEMFDEAILLKEEEAEAFYNDKVTVNEPDEMIDEKIVSAIKLKKDLGLELTENQQKAIDPEDDTVGITKNKNKIFSDFKDKKGITLKSLKK